jgi:hypothetical protein
LQNPPLESTESRYRPLVGVWIAIAVVILLPFAEAVSICYLVTRQVSEA